MKNEGKSRDFHIFKRKWRGKVCWTIVFCLRYDIKRAGYIIVTNRQEDEDILNPLVMQAAMQLWSIVQV